MDERAFIKHMTRYPLDVLKKDLVDIIMSVQISNITYAKIARGIIDIADKNTFMLFATDLYMKGYEDVIANSSVYSGGYRRSRGFDYSEDELSQREKGILQSYLRG